MTNTCNDTQTINSGRRALLKGGATLSVITLIPGVTLIAQAEAAVTGPATAANRWGMLIDVNSQASAWDTMISACKAENGWTGHDRATTDPQWIRAVKVTDPTTHNSKIVPVMCQHCEYPPCVDVCPTNASMKRADGIVLVDRHVCIGCRYCMMACPFSARSFAHEDVKRQREHMPRGKGTVESCTLCAHRIDEGRDPACVEALKAQGSNAVMFGDLNDAHSDIAKEVARLGGTRLRADLNVQPGVLYRGI